MSKPIEPDAQPKAEAIDPSRRRLLGMVKYVPPVVLGVISLQQSGCQPAPSCGPTGCGPFGNPCVPDGGPCVPNGSSCGPNPSNADPNTETAPLSGGSEVDPVSGS